MATRFDLARMPEERPGEPAQIIPSIVKALAKDAAPAKDHRRVLMGVQIFAGTRRDEEGAEIPVTRYTATDGKVLAVTEGRALALDAFMDAPVGLVPCQQCVLSVDALAMLAALTPKRPDTPAQNTVRLYWRADQVEKPVNDRDTVVAVAFDGRAATLPIAMGRYPDCCAVIPKNYRLAVARPVFAGKSVERVGRLLKNLSNDRTQSGEFFVPEKENRLHVIETENAADWTQSLIALMPLKREDYRNETKEQAAEIAKERVLEAIRGLNEYMDPETVRILRAEAFRLFGVGQ